MLRNNYTDFYRLVILLMFANIANYSFFTYTYSGAKLPVAINTVFVICRLLLALLPASIVLSGRFKAVGLKTGIRLNWDILLLMSIGIASSFFVKNSFYVLTYVVWMLCLTIVIIFWLSKQAKFSLEYKILELSSVFVYSHVIVLVLLVLNINDSTSDNYQMLFTSKNFYAYSLYILFFGIGLFLYVKYFLQIKTSGRPILFGASSVSLISVLLLCTYFIMISGRRSPLIATFLVLIALSLLIIRKSWLYRVVISVVGILVILNPIIFDGFRSLDRLEKIRVSEGRISESGHSNSLGERYEIWSTYSEVYKTYPIFGVGPGNAQHVQAEMFPHSPVSGYSPHNSYLAVLVEYGVIGLVLLLIVLARNMFLILRMKRGIRLLYISFTLGLAIICVFEYNSSPGQILFIPILITLLWPRFIPLTKV